MVSEIGRTEKGGKDVQTEQIAARTDTSHHNLESVPAIKSFEVISFKAFFAVDENKNVVIRIRDAEGNIVKQIPPAEYLKMAEILSESNKNLLHLEA